LENLVARMEQKRCYLEGTRQGIAVRFLEKTTQVVVPTVVVGLEAQPRDRPMGSLPMSDHRHRN
jgi:hypothetical protein